MLNNKPLLIDFDGVLRLGKETAPMLQEFFDFISHNKIPSCVISNSTLSCSDAIKMFFDEKHINTDIPIITAANATANYVKENYYTAKVFCSENVKFLFNDIEESDKPEAVVIGDLEDKWNYDLLNQMFRYICSGADIVAMHVNKYWDHPDKGLVLDAGAFIKGLEYATNKTATLIGKPSPLYFQSALKLIGLDPRSDFIMLGDDIESDITGAMRLGALSMLILTGKTQMEDLETANNIPHYIVSDLNEAMISLSE